MFRHVQLSIQVGFSAFQVERKQSTKSSIFLSSRQVKPEQEIVAHPVLQELTLLTRTRVEVFYKEFQTASVNGEYRFSCVMSLGYDLEKN